MIEILIKFGEYFTQIIKYYGFAFFFSVVFFSSVWLYFYIHRVEKNVKKSSKSPKESIFFNWSFLTKRIIDFFSKYSNNQNSLNESFNPQTQKKAQSILENKKKDCHHGSDLSSTQEQVIIYFGSQTGTAESFAKSLCDDISEKFIANLKIVDLEDFDEEEFFSSNLAIFIISTHGEGDPTDNAVEFFNWLGDADRDNDSEKFEGINFVLFGLGNTEYTNFNAAAKKLDLFLRMRGSKRLIRRGEGDASKDIEADFQKWQDHLMSCLRNETKQKGVLYKTITPKQEFDQDCIDTNDSPGSCNGISAFQDQRRDDLTYELIVNDSQDWIFSDDEKSTLEKRKRNRNIFSKFYLSSENVPVVDTRELRQIPYYEDGLSTFFIKLDLSKTNLKYSCADNLELLPKNSNELVEWFSRRLKMPSKNCDMNKFIEFMPKKSIISDEASDRRNIAWPFPTPCTIEEALSQCCDLSNLPSKHNLKKFVHFLKDPDMVLAFNKILSNEGAEDFKSHIKNSKMSLKEFFEIFLPGVEIELGAFLQLCSCLKPRIYTISSSPKKTPTEIALTVSLKCQKLGPLFEHLLYLKEKGYHIVDNVLKSDVFKQNRLLQGIASSYLCDAFLKDKGEFIKARTVKSLFRLPDDQNLPLIFVATGSGIAPFRSFLLEIQALREERNNYDYYRKIVLFFGCTDESKDFIYKNEILNEFLGEPLHKNTIIDHLFCAFSRQQEGKIYVQDKIKENSELVWRLLEKGGYIYVCGGTAMGKSVSSVIKKICEECSDDHYFTRLKKAGKYQEELWS